MKIFLVVLMKGFLIPCGDCLRIERDALLMNFYVKVTNDLILILLDLEFIILLN